MQMYFSVLLMIVNFVGAADIPCSARGGYEGEGWICACNSTYCDTVETPVTLDKTQYHHYKTSNSSAGFNHVVLNFEPESSSYRSVDEVVFKVNPADTLQEFLGIGGSFTDNMGLLFSSLSSGTQDRLMKSYFGPSGIEYSLGRVPIGGTDFSARKYTLDDYPFDEDLSHFSLTEEDFNLKIPMIKQAISLSKRPVKLFACTWLAPSWMKAEQTIYAGYIAEKYEALWATYHIKFLQAYKELGLEFWSISAGNEPMLLYIFPLSLGMLNSTFYTADSQAEWLKNHLKPQLLEANFTQVKFLGLDDQTAFLPYWMDRFNIDPEAQAAIDGVGLHWYFDWSTPEDEYAQILDTYHEKNPGKVVMYTEGSINAGFGDESVLLGSWYRAEGYIYRIFKMLDNWNIAFIDWNLFLNTDGGPSLSFGIESAVIVNTTSDEFYKQPIFYGIGHFAKFIQPGSLKVKVESNQNGTHNQRTFKLDSMGQFLPKRTLNDKPVIPPIVIPQKVMCLAVSNPDNSFSVIVVNTKNVTVPVRVEDSRVGSIVMDIEENSINSFLYWP